MRIKENRVHVMGKMYYVNRTRDTDILGEEVRVIKCN